MKGSTADVVSLHMLLILNQFAASYATHMQTPSLINIMWFLDLLG